MSLILLILLWLIFTLWEEHGWNLLNTRASFHTDMADVRFVGNLEFSGVWGVVINSSVEIVYPTVRHHLLHAGDVTKWFVAPLVAVYFWI